MRTRFHIALLTALIATAAHAGNVERIGEPVADVPKVVVSVTWVESTQQIQAAARRAGLVVPPNGATGFSILKRTATGEYVCTITAIKPSSWDDNKPLASLGHELMHCFAYSHR